MLPESDNGQGRLDQTMIWSGTAPQKLGTARLHSDRPGRRRGGLGLEMELNV
jgi:hypothetical protein